MSNCWLGEQRAFDFVLIKRTYISPSFGHIPHIITMMSSTHKASIGAHIFLNCLWESCSKHASSWFSTAAELSPQCHPCKTDVWEAIKIPQFLRYNPILALLHSIYPLSHYSTKSIESWSISSGNFHPPKNWILSLPFWESTNYSSWPMPG